MTRRDLLRLAASTAAGSSIGSSKPNGRQPIALSTLGCPKWDWDTIVRNTSQWGFAALELRGIQDQMDLPKCAEFGGTRLQGYVAGSGGRESRHFRSWCFCPDARTRSGQTRQAYGRGPPLHRSGT